MDQNKVSKSTRKKIHPADRDGSRGSGPPDCQLEKEGRRMLVKKGISPTESDTELTNHKNCHIPHKSGILIAVDGNLKCSPPWMTTMITSRPQPPQGKVGSLDVSVWLFSYYQCGEQGEGVTVKT